MGSQTCSSLPEATQLIHGRAKTETSILLAVPCGCPLTLFTTRRNSSSVFIYMALKSRDWVILIMISPSPSSLPPTLPQYVMNEGPKPFICIRRAISEVRSGARPIVPHIQVIVTSPSARMNLGYRQRPGKYSYILLSPH